MTIATEDKLKCAERELKMRERVYPRWVENGKLSDAKAAKEIAAMKAIYEDYLYAVGKERLP